MKCLKVTLEAEKSERPFLKKRRKMKSHERNEKAESRYECGGVWKIAQDQLGQCGVVGRGGGSLLQLNGPGGPTEATCRADIQLDWHHWTRELIFLAHSLSGG